MKLSKGVKIGLAIISASAIALVVVRRIKNKKMLKNIDDQLQGKIADPSNVGQKVISQQQAALLPEGTYPISIGDAPSKKILAIQQLLNSRFQTGIDLDGKYGQSTFNGMCKNIWSKEHLYSTETVSCTDVSESAKQGKHIARKITQEDYNKLVNYTK